MGTENFSHFDLKEVLAWPQVHIQENIDSVVSLINSSVASDDETALLSVNLALVTVVPCLPICDLEEKVLKKVCCFAEINFSSTLGGLERLQSLDGLSQTQCNSSEACSNLLSLGVELITNFLHGCGHIASNNSILIKYIKSYVKSSIKILIESFAHCQNATKLYGDRISGVQDALDNLYTVTCEFFGKLNTLLINHVDFQTSHEEDCEDLIDVVQELTKLSIQCLEDDVKILADAWKLLLHFSEKYREFIIMHFDAKTVVQALSKKIAYNFDAFLSLDISSMKGKIVLLKIGSFLLKILVKICSYFSVHLSEELGDVISLLLCLYRSTPSYLTAKGIPLNLVTEINKLLVIGADPLLNQIYSERAFISILPSALSEAVASNPYGTVMLLLSLLKKVGSSESMREAFIAASVNLLEWMFTALSACHGGMVSGELGPPGSTTIGQPVEEVDLYEVVLISTAVFVLSTPPQEYPAVEETLLKNVLTVEPWRAFLASDLWSLVARYADAQICHSTLNVLIPAFEKLDRSRPEVENLQNVIRRLLPLCEPHYLQNLASSFPPAGYVKLWGIANSESSVEASELLKSVLPFLKTFLLAENLTSAQLDKVENNLYILASVARSLPADVMESVAAVVADLWALNPSTPLSSFWWSRYVAASTAVTTAVLPIISPVTMFSILNCIEALLPKLQRSSQRLSILQILEAFGPVTLVGSPYQSFIIKKLSSLFRTLLTDNCVLLRESSLKTFTDFAHVTSHAEVISCAVAEDSHLQTVVANYLQKQLENEEQISAVPEVTKYVHRCASPLDNLPNQLKSKRVYPDAEVKSSVEPFSCDNDFQSEVSNVESQTKRPKFDSSAIMQSAVDEIQMKSQIIAENAEFVTLEQKRRILDVCKLLQNCL